MIDKVQGERKAGVMKDLYERLFAACSQDPSFQQDSHFVGMRGSKYGIHPVRFLLIGRAPNGWRKLPTDSVQNFAAEADRLFHKTDGFDWIQIRNGTLYNTDTDGNYCVDRSDFWTYPREIWSRLSGIEAEGIWMENIAWTNLYKISPMDGGNPSNESCRIQLPACREILTKELHEFDPTHILITTGYSWFVDFADLFENVHDTGKRNINRGKYRNQIFIEGTATYGSAKAVIACRPEYRDKKAYIEAVMESLNNSDLQG